MEAVISLCSSYWIVTPLRLDSAKEAATKAKDTVSEKLASATGITSVKSHTYHLSFHRVDTITS